MGLIRDVLGIGLDLLAGPSVEEERRATVSAWDRYHAERRAHGATSAAHVATKNALSAAEEDRQGWRLMWIELSNQVVKTIEVVNKERDLARKERDEARACVDLARENVTAATKKYDLYRETMREAGRLIGERSNALADENATLKNAVEALTKFAEEAVGLLSQDDVVRIVRIANANDYWTKVARRGLGE